MVQIAFLIAAGLVPHLGVARRNLTASTPWEDKFFINCVVFGGMVVMLATCILPEILPKLPRSDSKALELSVRMAASLGLLSAIHATLRPLQSCATWLHDSFKAEFDMDLEEGSKGEEEECYEFPEGDEKEKLAAEQLRREMEKTGARRHAKQLHHLESLLGSIVLLFVWFLLSAVNKNIESPLRLSQAHYFGSFIYTSALVGFPFRYLLDLTSRDQWRHTMNTSPPASKFQWRYGFLPAAVEYVITAPQYMFDRVMYFAFCDVIGFLPGTVLGCFLVLSGPRYPVFGSACGALVRKALRVCGSGQTVAEKAGEFQLE